MPELRRFKSVIAKLQAKAAKARADYNVSVIVGYTQSYALWVHENLQAVHPVGTAKYLERPARQFAYAIAYEVTQALKAGRTMAQALLRGGLLLQRESQKTVPVDTGALKNSAFTRLEDKGVPL